MGDAGAARAAAPAALVQRLRDAHGRMLEAVLGGEGLDGLAAVCAACAGAPVAVIVPRAGAPGCSPAWGGDRGALARYVTERLRGRPVPVPAAVVRETAVRSGDEELGRVLLLGPSSAPDVPELLQLAAVVCLTEVAVLHAREEVEQNVRGSLLEELRRAGGGPLDGPSIARRAARLGCDVSGGAVVLCAELATQRPRQMLALVADEWPGALAETLDGRVYALLPAHGDESAPVRARRLAARLERHGVAGISSACADPAALGRAVAEAELVVEVARTGAGAGRSELGEGTYRLLFRVLASHPEEVRGFYEDTVAPLVAHDAQYRTELVATLEQFLAHDCTLVATAAAIHAHRHTVAYRLDRIRELTGLDPARVEDRERLGLGLKAYRLIAPRLPR